MTNFINSTSFEEEFEAAKKEELKFEETTQPAISVNKPWHNKKTSDHQSFESWRKQNNTKEQASAPTEQHSLSKAKYNMKHQEKDKGFRNYSNYERESIDSGVFDDVKDISNKDRKGR